MLNAWQAFFVPQPNNNLGGAGITAAFYTCAEGGKERLSISPKLKKLDGAAWVRRRWDSMATGCCMPGC